MNKRIDELLDRFTDMKLVQKMVTADDEKMDRVFEVLANACGSLVGVKVAKRGLRKRGASEAQVYWIPSVLVSLAFIRQELVKIRQELQKQTKITKKAARRPGPDHHS